MWQNRDETLDYARENETGISKNNDHLLLSHGMQRRDFLKLCALGGMSGLLVACGSTPVSSSGTPSPTSASPAPTPSPTQQPSPTPKSAPGDADWAGLAKNLKGPLVRPGSAQYNTAHQLFSTRFDSIMPAGIAYCTSTADVQACLSFANSFVVPFAVRSGGHSYAGYSTVSNGLVIDVTRMNQVSVNAGTGVATIGAGTRLIDVYAALANYGLALNAGSCATVGVAGLTLGGGHGVLARKFGLTIDSLLGAQVVLADGRVVNCNANQNADLFWALRGAGAGNFGVVTSFTFQAHPVSSLSIFTIYWPWSSAADVVDAWQRWGQQMPDELWANCVLTTNKQSGPGVLVNGVYVGAVSSLNPLLQQLRAKISAAPTGNYVGPSGVLDTMLIEAGCYGKTVEQCHLPTQTAQGQLGRDTSTAKSDYFNALLSRQAIDTLVNAINARQHDGTTGGGGFGMDMYGGAINRVAANATAFIHRNAVFSMQYTSSWVQGNSAADIATAKSWLTKTWQSMRPYASGFAYQNYIDPDLSNWQQAYYGSNLPRLQSVKATYDPGNLFRYAQGITA